MLVGVDDVHLLRDPRRGVVPAPVSAVITTRVKPGQEAGFRAWEQRIAKAQARSPGFQGYRFEPPIPGVQDDWLAILRFDSEAASAGLARLAGAPRAAARGGAVHRGIPRPRGAQRVRAMVHRR